MQKTVSVTGHDVEPSRHEEAVTEIVCPSDHRAHLALANATETWMANGGDCREALCQPRSCVWDTEVGNRRCREPRGREARQTQSGDTWVVEKENVS